MPVSASAAWLMATFLLCCAPGAAQAGGSDVIGAPQARDWLLRMHNAAAQRNYQGTLVVTAGGTMSSSRIAHYCEGNQTYERVEVLDGQPRSVLRHNEQVLTLWPAAKVARLEQRDPIAPFPALLTGSDEQLFERYEMVAEGPGRVAGHEASVFLLRPRDSWRFAQRLWAERGSHLLLRADVLSADGQVLETSAFSELSFGTKLRPDSVTAAMKQLDGYKVVKSTPHRTELESEGWQLKVPVAGFRQTSCFKRQLDAGGDARAGAADVLQAIFTDGLTYVSLFVEPYQAERHHPGSANTGATNTWMQPLGSSYWVTAIGDVPMATLKQFAAALERRR
jgi:sigma-E factor negative regulatory protein RseB